MGGSLHKQLLIPKHYLIQVSGWRAWGEGGGVRNALEERKGRGGLGPENLHTTNGPTRFFQW